MLYKETVSPTTLELLNKLIAEPLLKDFFLVGGTALSLQIGHRMSIDLDLFTTSEFDENALLESMETNYGFQLDYQQKNTLKGRIDDVKVDLIAHRYPLLENLITEDGVRMAGLKDIGAMKINAITGNGTRVKDYIDIAYLSSHLTSIELLEAYQGKYVNRNPLMAIKSLVYHQDIDFSDPVEMIEENYSWQFIKTRLDQMLEEPEILFEPLKYVELPKNEIKRKSRR
jgi:hypothetical protein